jgi:predicted dehydrogenase
VAVGDVGLTIPRRPYFQKELEFVISRSYGPGRYDPSYEEHGNDYPYGYVRWTEKRNMQAFVDMLVRGSVRMQPLITHRFPIHEAPAAYDLSAGKSGEPYLGILIKYPDDAALTHRVEIRSAKARNAQPMARRIGLGVVGAGGFVTDKLLPAFSKLDGIDLVGLANRTALSTRNVAQRFHFRYAASDLNELIGDPTVDLVLIGTPHGLHASQVVTALQAGKHVFVEKPLCLKLEELEEIQKALDSSPGRMLMVGFNRRFAPLARRLADAIRDRHEPLVVHYRVNAGYLPPDHWTQDPAVGGGRLLGEGCHFLDWMFWLTGSPAVGVYTTAMNDAGRYRADNFMTQIGFLDGSVGTLTYVANGSRLSGKERVEVYCEGQTLILNDFQHLEIARPGKLRLATTQLRAIDKGHAEECRLTVAALREGTSWPIPIADIVHSTRITLAAQASIHSGTPVRL